MTVCVSHVFMIVTGPLVGGGDHSTCPVSSGLLFPLSLRRCAVVWGPQSVSASVTQRLSSRSILLSDVLDTSPPFLRLPHTSLTSGCDERSSVPARLPNIRHCFPAVFTSGFLGKMRQWRRPLGGMWQQVSRPELKNNTALS